MSERQPQKELNGCAASLCAWVEEGQRRLPWRIEPTPYRVWVSEIMLQQTRIEAVIGYFERFMRELPTVQALAEVDPDRLMKLWEGLGYYSRARNLQKAARQIVSEYGGELPADYDALKGLAGIGEYTAGAIASIAFGIPVPAVDGNVLRVLARLTGCERDVMNGAVRRELTALAASLVPTDRPGTFNQALMELGERVCLPNTMPRCEHCPVAYACAVAGSERAAALPVRAPKKPRRIEERTVYVLLTKGTPGAVLLHKREDNGLLAGLWELPNTLRTSTYTLPVAGMRRVSDWLPLPESRHIFSHIEWHMNGVLALVEPCELPEGYAFCDEAALMRDRALPTAFRAYAHMLPTWLNQSPTKG